MIEPLSLSWAADTAFPISVWTIKQHLRISDAQLEPLLNDVHIPAAVQWAEAYMRRSILAKTHYLVLRDFPHEGAQEIELPRGKTQSVTSIVYSSANATTTLRGPTSGSPIGTQYRENLRSDTGGVLYPIYNGAWPYADTMAPEPVLITYSAGWTAATVPADIKHAICLYCADALEITGAADMGGNTDLAAKERLLDPWKVMRWY
jgi:hypothetical protein